jgi:hypothetical protein
MVGEVEKLGPGVPLQGIEKRPVEGRRCRRPSDPRGIARPFEASTKPPSRYSVHGSRPVVSTTSRHSGTSLSDAEAPETPLDLSFPTGHTRSFPPEPEGSGNPHGVLRLYSDVGVKVHGPGIPHPVRSASRVSHPLDGFLPSRFPATRTGAAHEVHPTEPFPSAEPHAFQRRCPLAVSGIACSCSEDQEFTMPRSSRALLPAEIRTCRSRSCGRPMLSWVSFASPERSPQAAAPASRHLPSCASHARSRGDRKCGASGL